MHAKEISSTNNPKIKELILLREKSKYRKVQQKFIVEGKREICAAVKSGYFLEELYQCTQISHEIPEIFIPEKLYLVTPHIYSKIALRDATEGLIAIFKTPEIKLESVILSENPLIIVLESVEKPGNIGAILRTADAAGADAVIICDSLSDIYNPNLIRASIGTVFSCNVITCSSEEAYQWLSKNNISILSAQLQDSKPYYDTDMKGGTAIVLGSESDGLKSFWRERSYKKIRIPMNGIADSLNISVTAAVLCFEAIRQRNIK